MLVYPSFRIAIRLIDLRVRLGEVLRRPKICSLINGRLSWP